MEILSPAGSAEGLTAAVKGGCDAVYLGGRMFGARAFAANFSDREIEGAVGYCHDNGVKVYVTVNTAIKDAEMDAAAGFVRFLDDIGADAVLIQDLGLLKSISRFDIPKHASTQMGIHNASGLRWCGRNGLTRAVLSRELTFEELKTVVEDSPVETEVFIQGAMCYSISGGCLFSGLVGGRSGNRGQCAQPCRKRYVGDGRDGYLLSCKDIYGADWVEPLRSIGITSLKIEGRMRSHAYAYLATKVYSMIRDGVPREEIEETDRLLKTVFNRGYGPGYLAGVVSPVQQRFADNRGYYLGTTGIRDRRFDTALLDVPVHVRDGISIFKEDVKIGGFRLSNLGRTASPFAIPDGVYDFYRTYDPEIDAIKNLIGEPPVLTGDRTSEPLRINRKAFDRPAGRPELSFYVNSLKTLDAVLPYADRIYYDAGGNLTAARRMCAASAVECVANLPRLLPAGGSADGPTMIHSPGQIGYGEGDAVYGSYLMNAFNSGFDAKLHQTTLSVELSREEIGLIARQHPGRLEVMVFGRTELMCTRDPAMSDGMLTDEKGFVFPVYRDAHGLSHILNSSDLLLLPYMREIAGMGIDSVGIDLRKRPVQLAKTVARAFAEGDVSAKGRITEMCNGINYGAYLKAVE